MDLDRRVRRGRERLAQDAEPVPPAPLSAEKSEQLSVLEEKIKNLLEQVEALGESGKVDEAEALMRKVLPSVLYTCRTPTCCLHTRIFLDKFRCESLVSSPMKSPLDWHPKAENIVMIQKQLASIYFCICILNGFLSGCACLISLHC